MEDVWDVLGRLAEESEHLVPAPVLESMKRHENELAEEMDENLRQIEELLERVISARKERRHES